MRFKWALAKQMFPDLTKTYYENTWPKKVPRGTKARRATVINHISPIHQPLTDWELEWMKSFKLFIKKADAALNRGPAANEELFFLFWAGYGALNAKGELFETSRNGEFRQSVGAFIQKGLEVSKYIDGISMRERQMIVDKIGRRPTLNTDTWEIVKE
jgi:hypothetical protein